MTETRPSFAGRRILIWGATGSGKTTLARRLGEALNLSVIELDDLFWQPDWQETPAEEFRAKVREALDATSEGWVCDGNYRSRIGDIAFAQADTVLWLHLSWRLSFLRLFKRTLRRAWTKEPMWSAGNRESWRQSFLSRDSILLWSITNHRQTIESSRRWLAGLSSSTRVYELRSAREVEALLRAAEASRPSRASGRAGLKTRFVRESGST